MHPDRRKLYKSLAVILGLAILITCVTQISRRNSMTLSEYEAEHPELAEGSGKTPDLSGADETSTGATADPLHGDTDSADALSREDTEAFPDTLREDADSAADALPEDSGVSSPELIGATLNGDLVAEERVTLTDDFYYEPLSENLRRYITGISYPSSPEDAAVSYEDLSYVHVLYYDFDGNPAEGELICNNYITQDIVEIFYELYNNEYRIEKIRLIDEYDGDDTASMEDNNTSCFNYRTVPESANLSKHALGLAIDVNPLYNPYITYNADGTENISPVSAAIYADRNTAFPYKIDENDLCCRLFLQHGFTWGGNWNSCKDYQHFQKTPR